METKVFGVFTITEEAPTRAFSLLKVYILNTTYVFKKLCCGTKTKLHDCGMTFLVYTWWCLLVTYFVYGPLL